MKEQLFTSSIYSLIFLGIFALSEFTRRCFPKFREISRKCAHIFCGITALSFPYFISSHWTVLGLVILFSILMLLTKKLNLLQSIHEVGRNSYGSFYYPAAIYLIFFLASNQPVIYFISILVMALSDAFAALAGKKYGTIRFEVEGNTKSLEGSAVFLFATFLCVHLPLLLMTDIGRIESVLIATVLSILLTGFEIISPSGSDNIAIPFGTYFLLSKMVPLPLDWIIWDVKMLIFVIGLTTILLRFIKPGGLIGVMLLNYASVTLCDTYWLFPLVATEILFYLLVNNPSFKKEKKFPIKTLFYIGIVPVALIFISNIYKDSQLFYVPFLVAVAGQIPLTFHNQLTKTWGVHSRFIIALYSVAATSLVIIPSLYFFYQDIFFKALLITSCSILLIYVLINGIPYIFSPIERAKNHFRFRTVCTAVGALIAFLFITQGVHFV